jgi:hypothetical protein
MLLLSLIYFQLLNASKKYRWQGSSEHKGRGVGIDRQEVQELRRRLSDLLAISEEARWLDDGDFTLHRFLVSRNHDLAAAEDMFRGTVKWRTRHNVRGELTKWRQHDCAERRQAGLYEYAARCGHTSAGNPVNVERVGKYDIAGCVRVPGMTDLVAKAYIMYLEETFQDVRAASRNENSYIRARVVSDASGVGLAHVKHSRFMRDVIKVEFDFLRVHMFCSARARDRDTIGKEGYTVVTLKYTCIPKRACTVRQNDSFTVFVFVFRFTCLLGRAAKLPGMRGMRARRARAAQHVHSLELGREAVPAGALDFQSANRRQRL